MRLALTTPPSAYAWFRPKSSAGTANEGGLLASRLVASSAGKQAKPSIIKGHTLYFLTGNNLGFWLPDFEESVPIFHCVLLK